MTRSRRYADRGDAGRALAPLLRRWRGRDAVVLALPRGGVPVAAPVAAELDAPLDVLVVRKLGLPSHPELAMGAVAGFGDGVEVVRNEQVLSRAGVSDEEFARVLARERAELQRRQQAYRGDRPGPQVAGRTVVLVDDGLATGSTVRAAVAAVRRRGPAEVVVAVPIGSADTCAALRPAADAVVCAWTPEPFLAVGQGYDDFRQTTDDEVRAALAGAG